VLARFGVDLKALEVERLFTAAVAMAVLEGRVDPRPLPAGRGTELGERLFEGEPAAPRLRESAAARALAALEPAVEPTALAELRRLVNATLEQLRTELGTPFLQERRLDPTLAVLLPMESGATP
jgi:Family of unknown function (DUF6178)